MREAAFRRSGRGKGMEKAAAPSDEGASEAICGANRRRAPSGGRRSENGIAAFSMPRYFAVWLTPRYINSADSVQRRARPAFGEAESSKGGQALPEPCAPSLAYARLFLSEVLIKSGMQIVQTDYSCTITENMQAGCVPRFIQCFLSCQNATALAAATLSESTPCDMGMRTV